MKRIAAKLDKHASLQSIRRGLIMILPLLMIGSFALVLKFLPIGFYQRFITQFAGGFLVDFFTGINQATFDILAVALNLSISYHYAVQKSRQHTILLGAIITSFSVNMIFAGLLSESFNVSSFGAEGMFTAIFSALCASAAFCAIALRRPYMPRLYTMGADAAFNSVVALILPSTVIILAAFSLNQGIVHIFGVSGLDALVQLSVNSLFSAIHSEGLQAVLFVLLSSVFWFFGLHGSNVLHAVELHIFADATTQIISKEFLDLFVLMGGCGATICLLVAILLFSKQKNNRRLSRMAALPMLFNINELMVFGLPVVFNFSFFIPFIITPLLCMTSAYIAVSTGLVPLPVNPVSWVTPVVAGGYIATGSIAGSLLQIFNIAMGTMVYRHFVIRYEKKANDRLQEDLKRLVSTLQDSEASNTPISLLSLAGDEGNVSKMLAEDLRYVLKNPDTLFVHYQPQFHYKDGCVGAEALLRWDHPRCGFIYPPLVVQLAKEANLLFQLETQIYRMVFADIRRMHNEGMDPGKISVNVTAETLQQREFLDFLKAHIGMQPELRGILRIELTEQMSFLLDDPDKNFVPAIQELGISFAIDDFSVGYTSVRYLQNSRVDLVKLDGSLTRDMMQNARSQEIISSIMHMANTMHFKVVAEYVETREMRDKLVELGCVYHQGYYYSKPLPIEEFISLLHKPTTCK